MCSLTKPAGYFFRPALCSREKCGAALFPAAFTAQAEFLDSALSAAALYERIAVGTFRNCGIGLVGTHADAVKTAVVLVDHVVLTLGNGAVDVAVLLFDLHDVLSNSKGSYRRINAPGGTLSVCPESAGLYKRI